MCCFHFRKCLLTSVLRLPSSVSCWRSCGNQRRSSCPSLVWGPVLQQSQNLHTHDATGSVPPTDGRPSQCPHKDPPGTPTEVRRSAGKEKRGIKTLTKTNNKCVVVPTWKHFLSTVHWYSGDTNLRWHNFSIGAIDFDPCIEACLVVALHNVPSISILCPHPTVVRSLKWMTWWEAC